MNSETTQTFAQIVHAGLQQRPQNCSLQARCNDRPNRPRRDRPLHRVNERSPRASATATANPTGLQFWRQLGQLSRV